MSNVSCGSRSFHYAEDFCCSLKEEILSILESFISKPAFNQSATDSAAQRQAIAWFLAGTVAFGAGCLGWLYLGLPWPKCWLRHLFGIPCPACGSTRCALGLVHGQFGRAFLLNPLMCLLFCAVLLVDLYAVAVLTLRYPAIRLPVNGSQIKKPLAVALGAAIMANWIYLLLHR